MAGRKRSPGTRQNRKRDRTFIEPKIKPGLWWVYLDGWRLGLLSYRKKGKSAYVRTLAGPYRLSPEDLMVAPCLQADGLRRFEEILSQHGHH